MTPNMDSVVSLVGVTLILSGGLGCCAASQPPLLWYSPFEIELVLEKRFQTGAPLEEVLSYLGEISEDVSDPVSIDASPTTLSGVILRGNRGYSQETLDSVAIEVSALLGEYRAFFVTSVRIYAGFDEAGGLLEFHVVKTMDGP